LNASPHLQDDRDDDEDEDDDYDKRGHVRYHDEDAKKRSFRDKPITPRNSKNQNFKSNEKHFDELEDVRRRSTVPRKPDVD